MFTVKMSPKPWYAKMYWANQNDKFKSELVEAALLGLFAIEMPFPTTRLSEPMLNVELFGASTHLERIKIMKRHFAVKEFHEFLQNMDYLQKDDRVAEMFMAKYEEFFTSFDDKMALRSLNLATMFATSKIIGEIYRKRSSLLFILRNWKDCLQDTDLGLRINCPEAMMEMLCGRQQRCEFLRTHEKYKKPEDIAKREFRDNSLFQLYKGKNDKIPAASSVVEIRRDDEKGRGLFVTEDVEPGTTLLIEDPYATTLNEGLNWVIKHCWRCLKIILTTIPCEGCVFAVYCSEQCRSEDAKLGHEYECQCLTYFHGAFPGSNAHLSYKTILKAGREELFNVYKSSTLEDVQKTKGIDPKTGVYDSTAYLTTLNLASHIENDRNIAHLVWAVLSFVEILDIKTNFFAQVEESEKENFKDFVASLALFHNLSVPFNCLALDEEVDSNESIGLSTGKTNVCFVSGVYPLISLMNHGCDPNVNRAHALNGKMAIMTLRGLKCGEELLFGYGFDYATHDLQERQESLLRMYLFHCQCLACKLDWPVYEVLRDRVSQLKLRCPDCTDRFGYDDSNKCTLIDSKVGFGDCPACSKKIPLQDLYEELGAHASVLQLSRQFLSAKTPVPAIRLLLDYIKLIQSRVSQPSYEFCIAQRILATAYCNVTED